jgi:hypothetical protein
MPFRKNDPAPPIPGRSIDTAQPEIHDAVAEAFHDFAEQVKTLKVLA